MLHTHPDLDTRFAVGGVSAAAAINEAHANIQLAHRHLEDARMRCGKILQAMDGGTSCYDKKKEGE